MSCRADNRIKMGDEPTLDGVADEDRATVRDLIYVVNALKGFVSWAVKPEDHWYELVALTDAKSNTEIGWHDLDLIKAVDRLRVDYVAVRGVAGQPGALSLIVHVLRKSEPVVLEEQDIIRIQRKRKFTRS